MIKEVCDIIGHHHHPREEETINFKCLYDADLITNLEEIPNQETSSAEASTESGETAKEAQGLTIDAPLNGTFYRSTIFI